MRPLELKLRNFKSYFGDAAEFDFRERRLVGIVGPIGSGKSSILDAIAFALYGRTPTVAANTKSLIHQRAAEATVSLRFEVEGQTWEAVRMLRRKGASQHALYRYDDDADTEPVEKILLEGEVNSRVTALLGLEYAAFGRSVLLAQGRFAEFLRARPAERDKVLKGVFGHDRVDAMREAARARAGTAAIDVEKLTVRVEQLDRRREELKESRLLLVETDALVRMLKKAEPDVKAIDDRLAAASVAAVEAERRLVDLVEHERRFPDPATADRVVADAVAAGGVRARRATALDTARRALKEADKKASGQREAGEAAAIDEASALVAKLDPLRSSVVEAVRRHDRVVGRLDAQKLRAASARAAVDVAAQKAASAAKGAADAAAAVKVAATALHDAEHADMAASLRSGLASGDPCPVCAQTVTDIPTSAGAPGLREARDGHSAATTAAESADAARVRSAEAHAVAVKESEDAGAAVSGLEEESAAAHREADEARSGVSAVERELEGILGKGDPLELLGARRKALEEISTAAVAAREAADRARADHDQAIRDEQAAEKGLSALRIDLTDLAARIGVTVGDTDGTPEGVGSLLTGLRSAWDEAKGVAQTAGRDAAAERDSATQARNVLLAGLGVEGDFATTLSEASARGDLLRDDTARREAELAEGAGLIAERDALAGVKATYDRVASDLTDARFVRYLLDEERARLAALGSDHFLRLSAGRYLYSDDGTFDVIDQTSAGAIRKAESLSGGETFLASLALALALAEMVTRTGGRLDSFFLDEGFGSLDPEHLDLAMDGIEALVAGVGERLVVVVSHVPELRERFEDLIVLDRDPATGDTRILHA
jgi:exonuclease SbcC